MKNALIHGLFLLFEICVFGDAETVSVSVIEGDSVTLGTDVTEIQSSDVIEWRLNGNRIARISGNSIKTEGASRDRLQLDKQTGDLKITDIKTTDSGEYILKIRNARVSSEKTFNVSVSADAVKTVSVLVGDSVTLNTEEICDVIQWRFEHLISPIAEINRTAGIFSTYDVSDGRFGDRLQLDCLTGSLTIKNIGTKHSGVYEVDVRISSGYTIHKSFTVTVSGEMKSVSVKEGKPVTLNSSLTEIQTHDVMQWKFGDSVLAEINKGQQRFPTSDERYRGRLKLDPQTGSLTITNTTNTDSGVYELKISSSRFSINKRITVTVTVTVTGLSPGAIAGIVIGVLLLVCGAAAAAVIYHRRKISELKEWVYKWGIQSVMVGETITLTPDEEHKDNKLLWIFRGSCIAARESAAHSFTVYDHLPDGRFEGRLKLNHQTGSLTIPMTRTTDTGVYELMIIRPGDISIKRFSVSVFAQTDMKPVSVKEGGPVTLKTDVTDIQKDGQIQWKLGYTLLAKVKRGTKKVSPSANKIFQDRLELDHHTGSLTIKRIRPTDAGIYMLYKIEGGNLKTDLFKVEVLENKPEEESVRKNNPENVPLRSVHADSRL